MNDLLRTKYRINPKVWGQNSEFDGTQIFFLQKLTWNLQITHLERKMFFSPNLQRIMFQPFIFRGVYKIGSFKTSSTTSTTPHIAPPDGWESLARHLSHAEAPQIFPTNKGRKVAVDQTNVSRITISYIYIIIHSYMIFISYTYICYISIIYIHTTKYILYTRRFIKSLGNPDVFCRILHSMGVGRRLLHQKSRESCFWRERSFQAWICCLRGRLVCFRVGMLDSYPPGN